MKRIIHTLLFVLVLILPLGLAGQNQGFKLPGKKQPTTKTAPKTKTAGKKSGTKSAGSAAKQPTKPSQSSQRSQHSQSVQREIPQVIQNLIANMVYVEGGTFTMGATSEQGSDAYNGEKPTHQVTLSSFSIGKYEVTQAEWQAVMGNNPSRFTGDSRRPVESVSWNDCQEFVRKLNAMTGKRFRLPTEAEWEFAARGGNRSRGYKYAGSNTLGNVAWYDNNRTHPVGTKSPNELGLYDMSGNVCEWCNDWLGSYSSNSQYNPIGPASGSSRVYRGGGWFHSARLCRVSYRNDDTPSSSGSDLGLRLAL